MGRLTCPFSNSLIFLRCGEIKTRFTRHIEACGKEPMLLRGSKFYYSLPPKSVWGIPFMVSSICCMRRTKLRVDMRFRVTSIL